MFLRWLFAVTVFSLTVLGACHLWEGAVGEKVYLRQQVNPQCLTFPTVPSSVLPLSILAPQREMYAIYF